jgi:hypothetical protein
MAQYFRRLQIFRSTAFKTLNIILQALSLHVLQVRVLETTHDGVVVCKPTMCYSGLLILENDVLTKAAKIK